MCLSDTQCETECFDGADDRIFDTILADVMPKGEDYWPVGTLRTIGLNPPSIVYFNFKQHAISPAHYLPVRATSSTMLPRVAEMSRCHF